MSTETERNTTHMFRLDGKVAIITGAAGLLGLQHAIALSECGAHVILTDMDLENCEKRARQINQQSKVETLAIRSDVTSQPSWQSLLDRVLSTFGRVDILVNNAAFTTQSRSANYYQHGVAVWRRKSPSPDVLWYRDPPARSVLGQQGRRDRFDPLFGNLVGRSGSKSQLHNTGGST